MPSLEIPRVEANLVLAPHLASGSQLIVAAALVGDEDDFGVWIWRCKDWRSALGAALRYIYGSEAARTFERATRAPKHVNGWHTAVVDELRRLQETLEMLSELSEELHRIDAAALGTAEEEAPGVERVDLVAS